MKSELELKYGNSSTYKFELDKDKLESLSDKFNVSKNQTLFLFQLVNGEFDKLTELLTAMKTKFVGYCPDTVEEVNQILNQNQLTN